MKSFCDVTLNSVGSVVLEFKTIVDYTAVNKIKKMFQVTLIRCRFSLNILVLVR